MDIKQLEYFVRVAELGSFTRASQALGVAQPALSRQIRLLEVELRQNLLTRNGRGALPTEAGQLLLEHGRGILHQMALAREELGRARGALAGHAAISLPPSLSRLVTVPLTRALRQAMPDAQFSLKEGFSVLMLDALRMGSLDLALLYNPPESPEIELQPIYDDPLVLVAHRGSAAAGEGGALRLAQVAELPLVLPSRPNAFRLLIEREMGLIGRRPQVVMEVDGLNGILGLVQDELGAAVLPAYTLAHFEDAQQFVLRPIHGPRLMCELVLAMSAYRPLTATQQQVVSVLRQVVLAAMQPYGALTASA
ncbi:LysR family transcriptional regulator [Amphibiibacter pelophylacis]|uniref:LysR substrate-binding domain-containing protein n=1 Tax=Amphibiibacter pelophylacis TaxID=1799477 RepID=A0ACC6P064_9BURK